MTDNFLIPEINVLIEDTKNRLLNNEYGIVSINLFMEKFDSDEDLKSLKHSYERDIQNICTLIRNIVLKKAVIEKACNIEC